MAALSWEVAWQIRAILALGMSSWGTAVTLAVTMGGMSAGALLSGHILKGKAVSRPLRIYGALEFIIGLAGLTLGMAFHLVESIDTWLYGVLNHESVLLHALGIACVLGIPTMAMGATLPVLGLIGQQFRISIAVLYGLNTLGAAFGVLAAAFLFIPLLGMNGMSVFIAFINIFVGFIAWIQPAGPIVGMESEQEPSNQTDISYNLATILVVVTGFATFALEVAWFRSLTAAFMSTTEAFAIMLACVLISLGAGAWMVSTLKKMRIPIGTILAMSGILILLATPLVERFDIFTNTLAYNPYSLFFQWFSLSLYVLGPPILLLGILLPWVLDSQTNPKQWGFLYGLNALAAIFGALLTAWVLLPSFGFAKTAWMIGALVAFVGLVISADKKRRNLIALCAVMALTLAIVFESGVGTKRIQGPSPLDKPFKVLKAYQGPDVATAAIEYEDGGRVLYIDGFAATAQAEEGKLSQGAHYMKWMGHLPMILHPNPKQALVICFGTGQTLNAVRNENPESLDIVDINPNVFKLSHYFTANDRVLDDKRVQKTIMDGRAYMRRTSKIYDIITLEPMPPVFAGVNALYSYEFYKLAREKLGPDGIIAQWVPFHIVSPKYAESVAETFRSVFPNSILWLDPQSQTGILVGSVNESIALGTQWPGLSRSADGRDLSPSEIKDAILLSVDQLKEYGANAEIVTDDNQILAYGEAAHDMRNLENLDQSKQHTILNRNKDSTITD